MGRRDTYVRAESYICQRQSNLMRRRLQGFSRMANYAPYYKGVRNIIATGAGEAVGNVFMVWSEERRLLFQMSNIEYSDDPSERQLPSNGWHPRELSVKVR